MIIFPFACFDTARILDHCFVNGTDHVGEPPLGIKTVRRGNKPSQSVQAIFKLSFFFFFSNSHFSEYPRQTYAFSLGQKGPRLSRGQLQFSPREFSKRINELALPHTHNAGGKE